MPCAMGLRPSQIRRTCLTSDVARLLSLSVLPALSPTMLHILILSNRNRSTHRYLDVYTILARQTSLPLFRCTYQRLDSNAAASALSSGLDELP